MMFYTFGEIKETKKTKGAGRSIIGGGGIFIYSCSQTVKTSEMNITGTLPQAGNLKLFVPSLSTQGSTRPKQNIFNV